jgi:predicted nucleic acid-binding protein
VICADTSSFVALLQGDQGRDVEVLARALTQRTLFLSPVSVTELLSDPELAPALEKLVLRIPQLEIRPGYWERAGKLRARLINQRFRAKIADSLITQSCLDYQVPLVTRDGDFRAFQKLTDLRLLLATGP